MKGGRQRSQQLLEWICSTLSNQLFIIVQTPASLLEHPSFSMRFRFIWPSMNACPPVGPVYIADWKLQLATLRSGDWWLWFIETFRPPPIRLVAFSMPGHLYFSMKQGWCWHYCNFYEKKKVFSMIRKCPK